MNREFIDGLATRLAASLPEGLKAVRDDVEANFRAVLKSSLARMDLVTREEFEVQEMVLARTREKLEALEQRLAAYENAGRAAASAREAPAVPPPEPGNETDDKAPAAPGAKKAGKAKKKASGKRGKKTARKAAGKAGTTTGKKKKKTS